MTDFHDLANTIAGARFSAAFGSSYAPPPAPRAAKETVTEWGVRQYSSAVLGPYSSEGAALRTLTAERNALRGMGIPEQYWPILVTREVETTVSSWKQLDD